jgi:hypothetical protein
MVILSQNLDADLGALPLRKLLFELQPRPGAQGGPTAGPEQGLYSNG